MSERRIPTAEVLERLHCSRTTLWRMVRDGEFPKAVKRGLWREADVDEAIRGPANDDGDPWSVNPDAIAAARAAARNAEKKKGRHLPGAVRGSARSAA